MHPKLIDIFVLQLKLGSVELSRVPDLVSANLSIFGALLNQSNNTSEECRRMELKLKKEKEVADAALKVGINI